MGELFSIDLLGTESGGSFAERRGVAILSWLACCGGGRRGNRRFRLGMTTKERQQRSREQGFCSRLYLQAARKPNFVLDDHSSRPVITDGLQQPTRRFRQLHSSPWAHRAGARRPLRRRRPNSLPIWSCSVWGLPCVASYQPQPVRSYRTFSPLPAPLRAAGWRYVLCCTGRRLALTRASRTLSGTLPCGVRTFLPRQTPLRAKPAAIVRPPAGLSVASGGPEELSSPAA